MFVGFTKDEPKEFYFVKKPEIMEIVWKMAKSVVVKGIVLKAPLRWKSQLLFYVIWGKLLLSACVSSVKWK